MIIVTGAAGFIGSCLTGFLNSKGFSDLVIVDDFSNELKNRNLSGKSFSHRVDRREFFTWLDENHGSVDFIFHIGARTDTTEFNMSIFDELNLNYSKSIWEACSIFNIPLIYASSAATYGDGALGYDDIDPELSFRLKPLNPYGISKNEFDKWALKQEKKPPYWYGLKFFNVFGPDEYHKGRMASVVFHSYKQISEGKGVKLFRSHRPDYKDGEQLRDFVYVKDVLKVLFFLMNHKQNSGIYNLGTGKARTFTDLVKAVFSALDLKPEITFIDTPADIRDKYQYFTEARMEKLFSIGYSEKFYSLEDAIGDYVTNYLKEGLYL